MSLANNPPNPASRFIHAAAGPPSSIRELLSVPEGARDTSWLQSMLQTAVELELSTIPPYLCGLWSIETQSGPAYDLILSVVLEEMEHLGLACNMLTTIGGTPQINKPGPVHNYPTPLPGGVRPGLTVGLVGLSKDVVLDTFMQIEYPEGGPIALTAGMTYPTIGAFYDAILKAFQQADPSIFTGKHQLTSTAPVVVYPINALADAENAIKEIKEQGEGTSQSPLAVDFGGELAHYYRFAEIYHGATLVQNPDKSWSYTGAAVPFPPVYPMAEVPAGGYPESQAFDKLYTALLGQLQGAWEQGDQALLNQAIGAMFGLAGPARQLMQMPRPDGLGNFGPSFTLTATQGAQMAKIVYADITDYLTAIMNVESSPITNSPHGLWWNISYHEFTTGMVPNLPFPNPVPIMDTAHPLLSAFYLILTKTAGYPVPASPIVIVQMPKFGPFITDPGYTTKLANGTSITGAQIMANMESWLENGFPEV